MRVLDIATAMPAVHCLRWRPLALPTVVPSTSSTCSYWCSGSPRALAFVPLILDMAQAPPRIPPGLTRLVGMKVRARSHPGGRRRAMALVLLLTQVAPACAGVGAGLAYLVFHQLEHAIQVQLARDLHDFPIVVQASPEGLTHTHGPGTEPHTHGALVELALTSIEPDAGPDDGSEPPAPFRTDLRVAPHVPAAASTNADALPALLQVRGRWADAPEPPSTTRRPLVPPPRV